MNAVLVMFKDGERRDFPVSGPQTIVGRREDCDLRVPTKDVSRQHCAVLLEKDKLIAKDLGSSNGTFVNGKRIAEAALKAGDRLRVGPVTFVVQIDGKPAQITPQDVAPPAKPAAAAAAAAAKPAPADKQDEETFELSEADFDIDAVFEDMDDEKDMP